MNTNVKQTLLEYYAEIAGTHPELYAEPEEIQPVITRKAAPIRAKQEPTKRNRIGATGAIRLLEMINGKQL